MNTIKLYYARTTTTFKEDNYRQELEFTILLRNPSGMEHIAVHWAGDDQIWKIVPASFHGKNGPSHELWTARTNISSPSKTDLAGDISFAVQAKIDNQETWDNNQHANYLLKTDPGLLLGPDIELANISYRSVLPSDEIELPVILATSQSLRPKQVFVRWTNNNWQTQHHTQCTLLHDPSKRTPKNRHDYLSTNPVSLWSTTINANNCRTVEYAVVCETERGEEVWDNNLGINYVTNIAGLKILTLNLHCYQETDQLEKFSEIARAILELDIDIICLQEVCEEWNNGEGNWNCNAAKIIRDNLLDHGQEYHLHTDWSHIGFGQYREGSAILSRYKFFNHDAAYVSTSNDVHNIHSRKVLMAQICSPRVGRINVYSVHLSWWENGFEQQFDHLLQWARGMESPTFTETLLCGDFNIKSGSQAYMMIVDGHKYEDQFLRSTAPDIFSRVFRSDQKEREKELANDNRIDFIFAKKDSKLQPISAKIIFSGDRYRKVSDHPGYLAEFVLGPILMDLKSDAPTRFLPCLSQPLTIQKVPDKPTK